MFISIPWPDKTLALPYLRKSGIKWILFGSFSLVSFFLALSVYLSPNLKSNQIKITLLKVFPSGVDGPNLFLAPMGMELHYIYTQD